MDNRSSCQFAGDVDLQTIELSSLVTGKSIDLFNMFIELNIYEDIFCNTISGTISINDSLDLINTIPLVGEEVLHVVYKTPGLDDDIALIDKKFFIYKLSDRILNSEKSFVYVLHFMSEEGYGDMFTKLRRSYTGQLSEIVKRIFTEDDAMGSSSDIEIEPTANAYKFVAPNWSPLKCINWFTARSISIASNAPDYVFYQDVFKFNFKSISSLISEESFIKYYYNDIDPSTIAHDQELQQIKEINSYSIVESFVNDKVFDIADRMMLGFYASKLVEFDILSKKVNIKTLDYIDYFDKTKHLEEFPVNSKNFLRNPETHVVYYPTQFYLFDEFGSDDPMSWVLQRRSLLQQIESFRIDITVPGRSDIFVGKTIDFEYNTTQVHDTAEDAKEDTYSGKYLISAINHRLSRQNHQIVMTLVKDSITKDLG